ncbi:MAG: hypothetical protein ACJ8DI_26630, partial [Ktedonobacteraceae bacterium]
NDMGKYTSSSSFLLIKLPRPSGSFILLPSLLHRPSQAPPLKNLPVKRLPAPQAGSPRPRQGSFAPAPPLDEWMSVKSGVHLLLAAEGGNTL